MRLTDDHERVDIAFHLAGGRVILEAVPSAGTFGEAFGTVGGLVAGLADNQGQALLDGAARRMRALTAFDRVSVICGDQQAESSRGAFTGPLSMDADLPDMIVDTGAKTVAIFPRADDDEAARSALLRAPSDAIRPSREASGVRSPMRVPFTVGGVSGEFRCENRTPHAASLEIHAAAELFAQMVALRLELEGLRALDQQPAK